MERLEDGLGAARRDNPLGGAIVDVLEDDEVADALPVPPKAVAEVGGHGMRRSSAGEVAGLLLLPGTGITGPGRGAKSRPPGGRTSILN